MYIIYFAIQKGVNVCFLKVWDLPGGYCQLILHGHQAAVTCVQFDDTRVISGALDRLIKIWSLESGQVSGVKPAMCLVQTCLMISRPWYMYASSYLYIHVHRTHLVL